MHGDLTFIRYKNIIFIVCVPYDYKIEMWKKDGEKVRKVKNGFLTPHAVLLNDMVLCAELHKNWLLVIYLLFLSFDMGMQKYGPTFTSFLYNCSNQITCTRLIP